MSMAREDGRCRTAEARRVAGRPTVAYAGGAARASEVARITEHDVRRIDDGRCRDRGVERCAPPRWWRAPESMREVVDVGREDDGEGEGGDEDEDESESSDEGESGGEEDRAQPRISWYLTER
jgi:hypothetical protein